MDAQDKGALWLLAGITVIVLTVLVVWAMAADYQHQEKMKCYEVGGVPGGYSQAACVPWPSK